MENTGERKNSHLNLITYVDQAAHRSNNLLDALRLRRTRMRQSATLRAKITFESSKLSWNAFADYGALEKIRNYVKTTSWYLVDSNAGHGHRRNGVNTLFEILPQKNWVSVSKYREDLRKVERPISLFEATDISVTEAALIIELASTIWPRLSGLLSASKESLHGRIRSNSWQHKVRIHKRQNRKN